MVAVTAKVLGWIDTQAAAGRWEEDPDSLVSVEVVEAEDPLAGHPKLQHGPRGT